MARLETVRIEGVHIQGAQVGLRSIGGVVHVQQRLPRRIAGTARKRGGGAGGSLPHLVAALPAAVRLYGSILDGAAGKAGHRHGPLLPEVELVRQGFPVGHGHVQVVVQADPEIRRDGAARQQPQGERPRGIPLAGVEFRRVRDRKGQAAGGLVPGCADPMRRQPLGIFRAALQEGAVPGAVRQARRDKRGGTAGLPAQKQVRASQRPKRIHINVEGPGARLPDGHQPAVVHRTDVCPESSVRRQREGPGIRQHRLHAPVRIEYAPHLERQGHLVLPPPLQIEIRAIIRAQVETIRHISAVAAGRGIQAPAEFYVGQIGFDSAQIPGDQLVPGFQAVVRIPRKQRPLHVLRYIETEGGDRSVGGLHVGVVIALHQHIGRLHCLLRHIRERLKAPVRLAEVEPGVHEEFRIRTAAVERTVVDADGHFAEQTTAPVRIGKPLPGAHEAGGVDVPLDQRIRDAAGGDIRKSLPTVAADQVAAVKAIDQGLQRGFLNGERCIQRVLQIYGSAVRLADGIQVAQDVEIAQVQRHAHAQRHLRLLVQLLLPEKAGGGQLARFAAEHQHERAGPARLHIPEQGRLGAGVLRRRPQRQGHIHPARLPVLRCLLRREAGDQRFRSAGAQGQQAEQRGDERIISFHSCHHIKSQCFHNCCLPPSPAR